MPSLEDRIARHDNNFNVVRLLAASCVLYLHAVKKDMETAAKNGP